MLAERARGGERLACELELACNGMFGRRSQARAEAELVDAKLALFDERAWTLYFDFETLRALEREEDLDPAWAGKLRGELNRFCNEPDPAILAALYEHGNATHAHELYAIGHAHLDTAWLWPLAESYRKATRSFSSQVRYMDDYPEYRFACSQAVQLAWIEERNPELFGRIRAKVEAGQFVPVGGAWVEPDCNVPSGESLVRQFLHGQRYYASRFGARCKEFWSPDAFGYAGQLPQIMREAGITRFLTQKLSWNRFSKPEHHTFVWQGDDGSEVLGHFPPADNYSSNVQVPELAKAARQYLAHEYSGRSLLVFGHGDGGGGATKDMFETLRRARDLQGLPRTRTASSDEFFSALEAEEAERPVVVGELYLEYHRGTYTTQAAVKRGNRVCETLLHDAEFLATVAGDYPRAELDRLWKLLLLQQFHDILPGSSITLVYEDAARDFAEIESGAEALVRAALPAGDVPVNTAPFPRREVAEPPTGGLRVVEAPAYGFGAVVEPDDEVRVDGPRAREPSPARRARRRRDGALGPRQGLGPRDARRAGEPARALRRPPRRLRRVGRRPVPPADPARLPGRGVVAGRPRRAAARRDRVRAPALGAEPPAPGRPARRGLAEARVPHGGRLARGADAAEGLLPARRAGEERDLRDRLRLRRAADALLHQLRRGAVRGAGPPLRRPLRARLRRRRPDRLQVRLQLPRQRAAGQPAALAEEPRPRGGPGPARLRLRPPPPRGRLARGRASSPRRGASTSPSAGGTAARAPSPPSTRPASSSTRSSGPRTRTTSCCASTSPTAAAASRASGSRCRSREAVRANALEDERGPLEVEGDEIVVPFRPHELITITAR